MSTRLPRLTPAEVASPDEIGAGSRRPDATDFLQLWIILTLLLPARLVFAPLGAAGSPTQVLGMLAFGWWTVDRVIVRRKTARSPVRTALFVFVLAVLISYFVATTRPIEAAELSSADRGLLLVMSWLGLLLLTADGVSNRERMTTLLRTLVGWTALVAVLGVAQYFTGQAFVDQIQVPGLSANGGLRAFDRNGLDRAAGTATHPLEFAVLLATALPIALHLALNDEVRSRFRRWLPVVLIGSALPITLSRSAFLCLLAVFAVLLPSWPRARRRGALIALGLAMAVVYLTMPGLLGTVTKLFTGIAGDNSAQSRVDSYGLAFHFITLNPIFGRGFSTFLPTYRILDNQYLGLTVELGIVGVLAFLGLFVAAAITTARIRRHAVDPLDRDLAVTLMASASAMAVACATFDALGFPQAAGMLFVVLGLLVALSRVSGADAARALAGRAAHLGP